MMTAPVAARVEGTFREVEDLYAEWAARPGARRLRIASAPGTLPRLWTAEHRSPGATWAAFEDAA